MNPEDRSNINEFDTLFDKWWIDYDRGNTLEAEQFYTADE